MDRYVKVLGSVSPSAAGAQRVADVVAALAPPPSTAVAAPASVAMTKSESPATAVAKLVPGLVGGAIGYSMFRRSHPVLGFLGGHALGSAAFSLYKGGAERKKALCQLGVEAAAIGGALMWKRHPVLGWVAGAAVGAVATSFVPGSPTSDELAGLKAWVKKKTGR